MTASADAETQWIASLPRELRAPTLELMAKLTTLATAIACDLDGGSIAATLAKKKPMRGHIRSLSASNHVSTEDIEEHLSNRVRAKYGEDQAMTITSVLIALIRDEEESAT